MLGNIMSRIFKFCMQNEQLAANNNSANETGLQVHKQVFLQQANMKSNTVLHMQF